MSNKNSPLTNLSGCIFIVPSPDKFVTKDSNHGPGPSGSTDVNSVNQISAGMRRVQAVKNRKLRVPPITYSNESETTTTMIKNLFGSFWVFKRVFTTPKDKNDHLTELVPISYKGWFPRTFEFSPHVP